MRLFSFGGYGLALIAALALVVFGAIECPPTDIWFSVLCMSFFFVLFLRGLVTLRRGALVSVAVLGLQLSEERTLYLHANPTLWDSFTLLPSSFPDGPRGATTHLGERKVATLSEGSVAERRGVGGDRPRRVLIAFVFLARFSASFTTRTTIFRRRWRYGCLSTAQPTTI